MSSKWPVYRRVRPLFTKGKTTPIDKSLKEIKILRDDLQMFNLLPTNNDLACSFSSNLPTSLHGYDRRRDAHTKIWRN